MDRLIETGTTKPAQLELIIRIDPGNQVFVEFPPDELICYRMLFQAALIIGKKFQEQKQRVAPANGGDLTRLPPPPGG